MKYWDSTNGCITDDESFAPIYDGGDLYIETYSLNHYDKVRIDIAYTEAIKQSGFLYQFKESVCKSHGVRLNDLYRLVRLCVPTNKYKEIYGEVKDESAD